MTAPFHPQSERKPWYDRKISISWPNYLALATSWFAFWLRPSGALGGAFVLAMFTFVSIDLWRGMPRLRRQPRWVQELTIGGALLGFILALVLL